MKLYVLSKVDGKKIYLKAIARSRTELAKKYGKSILKIRGKQYSVNEVYAEKESSDTAAGALVGSILGILGGPIGFLIGGATGGLIGNSSESKEIEAVKHFNNSRYEKKR